jgi:hypothetical protein
MQEIEYPAMAQPFAKRLATLCNPTNRRQDEQDFTGWSGFCFGSVTVVLH